MENLLKLGDKLYFAVAPFRPSKRYGISVRDLRFVAWCSTNPHLGKQPADASAPTWCGGSTPDKAIAKLRWIEGLGDMP